LSRSVGFGGERKFGEVGQGFQVARVYAFAVALLLEADHVVVAVGQRPLQALQLQGRDFVATGQFNWFQVAGLGLAGGHACLLMECVNKR
jgi:hypothetical protein